MAISQRELYRRECASIAENDPRWSKADGDDCVVCGDFVPWRDPNGAVRCPSCWSWLEDAGADSIPLMAKPKIIPKRSDSAKVLCQNCGSRDLPEYEWHWVGVTVKKLALGAICLTCKRWVKWVDAKIYTQYAPPKPPVAMEATDEWLFDEIEPDTKKRTVYIDPSDSDGKKRGKQALPPPPPKNRAVSPTERAVLCYRLYEKGAKLYLNAKGEVCCTINWNEIPDEISVGVRSCAARLKRAIIEDILFQLRACEISPHVLHIHPKDKRRLARVDAWQSGDRTGLTDRPPEFTINEVIEMEREALGGFSPTALKLEKYEKGMDHDGAEAIVTNEKSGGLF